MSDEIYDHMVYDGETHVCLLSYPSIRDRLILLNGWSKTYAMTGWRLGYAVWPGKLYDYARKLAVNLHSCVNASAQYAGLAALTGPQDAVRKMVAEFDKRRKVVVEGLNQSAGRVVRDAEGRVLRLSQRQAHRLEGEGAGLVAARGCRRRHHRRPGFRHSRRGLCAAVLRQLDREHPEGARPHGRVPGDAARRRRPRDHGGRHARHHGNPRSLRRAAPDAAELPRFRRRRGDAVHPPELAARMGDESGRAAAAGDPRRRRADRHPHARRAGGVRRHRARPGDARCAPSRIIAEEIARGDSGLADKLVQNWKVSVLLRNLAPRHLQEKWFKRLLDDPQFLLAHCLTEPRGASDRWLPYNVPEAAMQTRAVKQNGEWVINGRKQFISNGYDAGLYVVYANTNPKVGMLQGTSSLPGAARHRRA